MFSKQPQQQAKGFVTHLDRQHQPKVLHLPLALVQDFCPQVIELIQALPNHEIPVLDFTATQTLDTFGAGLVLELYRLNGGLPLSSRGVSHAIEHLLQRHRILDFLKVENPP
jgi:hypothetical protein